MDHLEKYQIFKDKTRKNELSVLSSKSCFCLSCKSEIESHEIKDWVTIEGNASAVCPICGMSSIIPLDGLNETEISQLNEAAIYLYDSNICSYKKEEAELFVFSFEAGEINKTPITESTYENCLKILASYHDCAATAKLAEVLTFKKKGKENLKIANHYLSLPFMKKYPKTFSLLGRMCFLEKSDESFIQACNYFDKGIEEGDLGSVTYMAQILINGSKKSQVAGYKLLREYIPVFSKELFKFKTDISTIGDAYALLGMCFYKGRGTKKNHEEALRYFLAADFLYKIYYPQLLVFGEENYFPMICNQAIKEIAPRFQYSFGDPLYDEVTFESSFRSLFGHNLESWRYEIISFDKSTHSLELLITIDDSVLIIDTANLYANIQSGPIRWSFKNVKRISGESKGSICRIEGDSLNKLQFVCNPNGSTNGSLVIEFLQDNQEASYNIKVNKA